MRWTALAIVAFLAACDGGSDGSGSNSDTDGMSGSTGDGQTTASESSSSGGSNTTATTMPPGTNPATSSGADDESSSSSDGESSAGITTDDTDDTQGATSDSGSDEGGGSIDVTLTGCDVDFGGTVVVSYNGSLGVASVYDSGATLTGSFQFDLDGPATFQLSTQHRVDTMTIVNMVDIGQGTWTNLDSDALSGGVDSIGGTLDVQVWEPSEGRAEIVFDSVSLMNVSTGNVCTIDGTVVAEELYP